jgi:hypothetical protein
MDGPHVLSCASGGSARVPGATAVVPPASLKRSDPGRRVFRLNLPAIESSLRAVQVDFDRINRNLSVPRDVMTDEVRANMMAGYQFVDHALARGVDLFKLGNSKQLLEINILVLCGTDEDKRRQYARHIALTEQRFYDQPGGGIGAFIEWLQRHRQDDIWRRAAGAYIYTLSQPQLYIEGNHRTGALIMSYMLAREGQPPFVLCADNAKAYFEPSTLLKERKKHSLGMLLRLPGLKTSFAKLLKNHADMRYLISVP